MEVSKKLSFSEMKQKIDADKTNSDLLNLANSLMSISKERQEITKKLERLDDLENAINELAGEIENGTIADYNAVKKLHDKTFELTRGGL